MATKKKVNNVPYDFAAVTVDLDDQIIRGLRSISWEHGMEVEKNFGSDREAINRTEGVYNAEDTEVTMLESDYFRLVNHLGNGYMRKVFQSSLAYGFDGEPVHTAELFDCRIIGDAHDYSQGPEGLEVSLTLSIMKIKVDGIDPVKKN
jgi:hypothetical protein